MELSPGTRAHDVERAVAHELVEIHALMEKPDRATKASLEDGSHATSTTELSHHDLGRKAELEILLHERAATKDPALLRDNEREIDALLRALGFDPRTFSSDARARTLFGEASQRSVAGVLADAWIDEVRSRLKTQAERDAFTKMIGKRSHEDVKKSFADVDAAVKAVQGAVKRSADDKAFEGTEAARLREIEQYAKAHLAGDSRIAEVVRKLEAGLKATPEDEKVLLTTARSELRTIVMGDFVGAEIARDFPHHDIRRDVQVWEGQDPRYTTPEAFRQDNRALFSKSARGVRLIGTRVYLEITDIDFVVLTAGTRNVVHLKELKTGMNDTHLKAAGQLQDAKAAVARSVADPSAHPIVLLEGGKTDITKQIDMRSLLSASRATHGPAGKSFDPTQPQNVPGELADVRPENFKARADNLDKMIGKMLEDYRNPKPPRS